MMYNEIRRNGSSDGFFELFAFFRCFCIGYYDFESVGFEDEKYSTVARSPGWGKRTLRWV